MIVFGDYNILRKGPGNSAGNTTQPLIIHYQSLSPIIMHPYESGIKFMCEVMSEGFGEGLAQGLSNPQTVGGKTQASIRAILTFPGLGSSIEHRAKQWPVPFLGSSSLNMAKEVGRPTTNRGDPLP